MSHERPDSVDIADPHALLFGPDGADDPDADFHGLPLAGRTATEHVATGPRHHRQERLRRRRRRRARWVMVVLATVIVLIIALTGWFVARPFIASRLTPDDWSGAGAGTVRVEVHSGDASAEIGAELAKAGIVRSQRAFVRAAQQNADSALIQPGIYTLRAHMSAADALSLMLDPASRTVLTVSLPEGTTERDAVAKVARALGFPTAQVQAAAADVPNLGLPTEYTLSGGAAIRSAEGFLFPATYTLDPGSSPADVLQLMVAAFTRADRDAQFSAAAQAMHTTPYQALIVASLIEREVKFPEDRAKVARVIYNRLAAGDAIKVDAASIYGAVAAGKNPAKVDLTNVDTPYNTYTHTGLPPTPISNPGSAAMSAAVHPASGNWTHYVNGDAAGHLYFTASEDDFVKAVEKCHANHWGCG